MLKRRLVLSTALALGLLGACRKPPEAARIVTPVRVVPAEAAPAASAIHYSASLQAMTQVDVAFKVGGYVTKILQVPGPKGASHVLQQGDKVQKGVVLARFARPTTKPKWPRPRRSWPRRSPVWTRHSAT